jgi:hypothetical protein
MNDTVKKIAQGELNKLGLGKKEESVIDEVVTRHRRSYLDEEPDLGYGMGRSIASSPYPSLSRRTQLSQGEGYSMFAKPKQEERVSIKTPHRTYLKSEAEARLEEWRKMQKPENGRLNLSHSGYLAVVEEIHLAIGDLLEKAGITWGTQGSRLIKASVQDAVMTGFFLDEQGELYVIEVPA